MRPNKVRFVANNSVKDAHKKAMIGREEVVSIVCWRDIVILSVWLRCYNRLLSVECKLQRAYYTGLVT